MPRGTGIALKAFSLIIDQQSSCSSLLRKYLHFQRHNFTTDCHNDSVSLTFINVYQARLYIFPFSTLHTSSTTARSFFPFQLLLKHFKHGVLFTWTFLSQNPLNIKIIQRTNPKFNIKLSSYLNVIVH